MAVIQIAALAIPRPTAPSSKGGPRGPGPVPGRLWRPLHRGLAGHRPVAPGWLACYITPKESLGPASGSMAWWI